MTVLSLRYSPFFLWSDSASYGAGDIFYVLVRRADWRQYFDDFCADWLYHGPLAAACYLYLLPAWNWW